MHKRILHIKSFIRRFMKSCFEKCPFYLKSCLIRLPKLKKQIKNELTTKLQMIYQD